MDTNGFNYTVFNFNASSDNLYTILNNNTELSLRWTNILNLNIDLELRCNIERSLSKWKVFLKNSSKKFGLWTFSFLLDGLGAINGDNANISVLSGRSYGAIYDNPKNFGESALYPGCDYSMQLYSFYHSKLNTGLYFATHDPKGTIKKFSFGGSNEALPKNYLHVDFYPEGMGLITPDFTLNYDIVIATFQGDWYEASQIYKNWVIRDSVWTQKTLVERNDVPTWFRNLPLWLNTGWSFFSFERFFQLILKNRQPNDIFDPTIVSIFLFVFPLIFKTKIREILI